MYMPIMMVMNLRDFGLKVLSSASLRDSTWLSGAGEVGLVEDILGVALERLLGGGLEMLGLACVRLVCPRHCLYTLSFRVRQLLPLYMVSDICKGRGL